MVISICRRLTLDRRSLSEFVESAKGLQNAALLQPLLAAVQREMRNHAKYRILSSPATVEALAKVEKNWYFLATLPNTGLKIFKILQ